MNLNESDREKPYILILLNSDGLPYKIFFFSLHSHNISSDSYFILFSALDERECLVSIYSSKTALHIINYC